MRSEQKGVSRNTPNLQTNSVYLADKEGRGSKNAIILWTSHIEAPNHPLDLWSDTNVRFTFLKGLLLNLIGHTTPGHWGKIKIDSYCLIKWFHKEDFQVVNGCRRPRPRPPPPRPPPPPPPTTTTTTTPAPCTTLPPKINGMKIDLTYSTVWGGNLIKRFCNMFSENFLAWAACQLQYSQTNGLWNSQ